MKQMHGGLKIASFAHFIVYSQNNFPCSCYFLLPTINFSSLGSKEKSVLHKEIASISPKLHLLIMASRSWPSATRSKRLCTGMTRTREACAAQRSLHLPLAYRCFPLLPAGVHTNQPQWAQNAPFSTGGLKVGGLKNQCGIKNASQYLYIRLLAP